MKAQYHTLGCKLNFVETSAIGRVLAERGIESVDHDTRPDLIVVNTCSVTETADKKGRGLIRRLHRRYPDATIIVTGCYAQLRPGDLEKLPGVGLVLGTDEKLRMASYVDEWLKTGHHVADVTPVREICEFHHSCERGDRTRFFLKVQDGCDYYCTYCTIPYARGRSRSPRIGELVELARDAASRGGREIVITGVNIGDFGSGSDETFYDLVRALDEVEGIERYRISSIEPNLLTHEIIDYVGRSRAFMPHFHIPLQSGSDRVLRSMNRRYDTSLFRDRVEAVRSAIPHAFIGVDVIAGARGETPEEWERSYRFLESLDVTRLHVFPYSERPGTAALLLGDNVEPGERHRRVAALTDLSERKLARFAATMEGTERPVLWETCKRSGETHGLTDNYLRVALAGGHPEMVNTITSVRLGALDPRTGLVAATSTRPSNNEQRGPHEETGSHNT